MEFECPRFCSSPEAYAIFCGADLPDNNYTWYCIDCSREGYTSRLIPKEPNAQPLEESIPSPGEPESTPREDETSVSDRPSVSGA